MGVVTAVVLALTVFTCFLLIYIPNIHGLAESFYDEHIYYEGRQSVLDILKESEEVINEESSKEVRDLLKGHQIRLKLPANVTSASVNVENDFVNREVAISIKGIGKKYFDDSPMVGNSDHIVDVTYDSENMVGTITITMDDVLEPTMISEDEYIYFDFVDPHEIYDYIVVVDAGHGGNVPGATKQGVSEKDIDLAIILELKKMFDQTDKNIGVYYTRTEDVNPSFASRVGLANDTDADLFLSVHNNSTASGRMSSISGTEVMYRAADKSGESKLLSVICLNHLIDELHTKSKGTVVGDEIYIIRESKAPVALVEVGFMTNQKELDNLCDAEYQQRTAKALYEAVIEYLYEE